MSARACLTCGNLLKGRSDKKFCDDFCRNAHNNQHKSGATGLVKTVNNALGKNRRILEGLLEEGGETVKVNKEKLLDLGFQFKYTTHTYLTKAGKTYFYCYNYGYLPLENNWYLIVRLREGESWAIPRSNSHNRS